MWALFFTVKSRIHCLVIALLLVLHSAYATASEASPQRRLGTGSSMPRDLLLASLSADDVLETATSQYEQGNYEDAIGAFGRIILGTVAATQSQRNAALLGRAKLFLVISQPQLALSDLGLIQYPANAFSDNAQLNLVKGVAFIQAKQYAQAVAHLTRAEKAMEPNAMLLSNRAVAYQSLGRYELARQDLEASLRLERAEPTLYNLAVLEKFAGQYQRCVSILSGLIAERKSNPAVFQERGICLARLGQVDAAIGDLLKALAINQANPPVLEELGGLLAQKGDRDGARQYLESAASFYLQAGATTEYTRVLGKIEQLR